MGRHLAITKTCHHQFGLREVLSQAATFRASYYLRIEVGSPRPAERPESALRLIAITSVDFCRKITVGCSEILSMKATTDHLALVGNLLCWALYSWRLNCHSGFDSVVDARYSQAAEPRQLLLAQGL